MTTLEEEAKRLAAESVDEIERLIFESDVTQIVAPLLQEAPATVVKEGHRSELHSIKHVAQSVLASLAMTSTTRPESCPTWDRRRTSTAVSVLVATGLVKHLGIPPGYKRTLSLNRNLVAFCTCLPKLLEMYSKLVKTRLLLEDVRDDLAERFAVACKERGQHFEMPGAALSALQAMVVQQPSQTLPAFTPPMTEGVFDESDDSAPWIDFEDNEAATAAAPASML